VSRRFAVRAFPAWMALLTVGVYALPAWHLVLWPAIGLSSAVAVLAGMLRNRPGRRAPWILLALALAAFTIGDAGYEVLEDILHRPDPFPSFADIFYLAMYPLLAAGLLIFIRCRTGRGDRGSLLDAFTITAGLGLLGWIFLILPYVRDTSLTPLYKAVSIAYPLGDVLILATLARLLAGGGIRSPVLRLLGIGTVGLLVADVLYGLIQLNGSWQYGTPVDLGWVLFYAACGTAALHPSMTQLTERVPVPVGVELTGWRLGLLTLASLIAPGVLLFEAVAGTLYTLRDAGVIAVLSAVMFLLVLSRLAGVVKRHGQALDRERGLREASAALVSAADVEEVAAAVRGAAAQLLPPGLPHRVNLQVVDADAVDEHEAPPAEVPEMRASLVRTEDLDAEAAAELSDFATALSVPLALGDRPSGDPLVGRLLVGASEPALRLLWAPVEVLASQAALALERIALTNEVNRRDSEGYFRTLVHNTTDVILIVTEAGRVRYASPSAETFFGRNAVGVPLHTLVSPADRPGVEQALAEVRGGQTPTPVVEYRFLRVGGTAVQAEVSWRDLSHDPAVRGLVLTLRDVTERRQLEHELTHRTAYDALTGLPNRMRFIEYVEQAVERARRDGTLVGVFAIDVDDFRIVNETIGHARGDDLLTAIAARLTRTLRRPDSVARSSGDEFAALIEGARDITEVEEVAGRIVAAFAQPFEIGDQIVSVGASVGVATDADDGQELLRHADLALFVAKGDGKGRWRRYQASQHAAWTRRLELRAELEQALADYVFVVHYQPIVDLDTGRVAGLEALVRWQHPVRGMIPPGHFIDVAEETGLIVPLGIWVLEQALATAAGWRSDGVGFDYVSVNVSARQFGADGFVDTVLAAVDRAGVPPDVLLLEITESLLLRDNDQVWADLNALRRTGIRIAIDDFGTGYSSLSYLRLFPVDVLKIDKSFIDEIVDSDQQRAVVEAMVHLAGALQLRIIAEGIETPAQHEVLSAMGCQYGQGFLFSRPMPVADAERWLRTAQHSLMARPRA
jgi:diguanylate cyclase (GGDEF)-like protein/PAS domain S-box-containing protein